MAAFDDDDDFVVVGTALEPFEDDAVIRKKPIAIQDQIVTDDQGRRRFHGAFTGGFSAGYYNSVGSKEGWAPTSFKSTRNDRPSFKNQNAQDFMDDEDKSAFGIAPQLLRPTEDFSSNRRESLKRPRPTSEGPIPGVPVLQQIIQPVVESVGVKVLRKMGWRPAKGVGPKTHKKTQKKKVMKEDNTNKDKPTEVIHESVKVYSCLLPPSFSSLRSDDEDDTNSDSSPGDENLRPLLVRPQDVDSPLCNPKENIFGLGYKGLDRNTVLSGHVDLFGPALKFKVDNKKMNITGEAFGIGVFEDGDEEVYSRDDMTQYDFALETPAERKRRLQQEARNKRKNKDTNDSLIPGFITNKNPPTSSQFFPPPQLPCDFQPIHAQKKSRFGNFFMVSQDQENSLQINKKLGLDRHQLTREERHILLENDEDRRVLPAIEVPPSSQPSQSSAPKISFTIGSTKSSALSANSSNKVESKPENSSEKSTIDRIERLKKFTEVLQAYSSEKPKTDNTAFKPFLKHPGKQVRYDKYLTLKTAGYAECLRDLQPQEMTEWECEREKLEFERASALYQPMSGEMSSRFVSAKSHDISHIVPQREEEKEKDPTQDPKVAAKMNLFGKLTHKVVEWHPDRIVCKRFNVPPPYPDSKTVGSRIASSKIGTSGLQEEELKESISKKSLFDDLDLSKPPPGLLPSVSQLTFNPITGLSTPTDTATTPASSQQHHQLDFRPTSTFKAPANSANITAIFEIPVEDSSTVSSLRTTTTKPPLDLFKEIFADSSESEEENDDGNDGEKHSPSSTTTTTVNQGDDHEGKGVPKHREVLENSRKRDDKSVVSKELQSKRVGKRLSEEKSPRHEENRGIFHNLDFSKLTSPTSSAYTSSNPTIQSKRTSEGRNDNKLRDSVPQRSQNQLLTSSSKMQVDEDALKEEFFYGPALPSSANGKKITSESVLSQNQLHKLVGTSSGHLDSEYSSRSYAVPSVSSLRSVDKGEDTIWIEKDAGESSSKRRKKHSKKSKTKTKKRKRSGSRSRSDHHGRHSSKSKKSKRHKSSSSSKHKSLSKKHKRNKTGKSQRSKSGHRDKSESSYSSSSGTETDSSDSHGRRSESKSSDEARFPPVSIQYSQNSKALIAKLKEMI